MGQDFLQSIKLQISRTFKLTTYERIAFHKILSIQKSEIGKKILLNDLKRIAEVRKNAIYILKEFNDIDVSDALLELFSKDITLDEKFIILEHLEKYGTEKILPQLIDHVKTNLEKTTEIRMLSRLVDVIGKVGKNSQEVNSFLNDLVLNKSVFEKVRCAAITPSSIIDKFQYLETILSENNNNLAYAVYDSLSKIANSEMVKVISSNDNELFTPTLGENDKLLLDIRVFLGKMTVKYDEYSDETKTAFIRAMITCGHREFTIYTMKALTSSNKNLIDMTLYILRDNIKKIQSPVKLFRNLIYLSSITPRDNKLIVEIFISYFKDFKENRNKLMVKNTIYNYIVVTLDSYFESYRKKFMIPEIMEKDYPVEYQEIRKFILNKFSPDLKRRIQNSLAEEDVLHVKNLLQIISETVPEIYENEDNALQFFVEMLYENDPKARGIAATRIHDIDFEKKYLKTRIIRLCEIIKSLNVEEASTNLVKIFNYVKKYYDKDIYEAVTYTLSSLNYPYMLGELEILLVSAELKEKEWAVKLLSLFSEQRSLNIFLDYLKDNCSEDSSLIEMIISIVNKRDIKNDLNANEIAKSIIEKNQNPVIVSKAIVMLGATAYEKDMEYLNNLFMNHDNNIVKEAIVQGLELIIENLHDYKRRDIIQILDGFLKDPGIKVRMLACAIMLKMEHYEALKTIQDMMIIRNKTIQREILHILKNNIIPELAYFFISLLKEEYGISLDIIPILSYLPPEEIKEIDHFVINLFKKYEGTNYELGYQDIKSEEISKDKDGTKNFKAEDVTTLLLEFSGYYDLIKNFNAMQLSSLYHDLFKKILDITSKYEGDIARNTGGFVITYFSNTVNAAKCAKEIYSLILNINKTQKNNEEYLFKLFLLSDKKEIVNSEILIPDSTKFKILDESNLYNRIALDKKTMDLIEEKFRCNVLPSAIFDMRISSLNFYELEGYINFLPKCEIIIKEIKEKERERDRIEKELEENKKAKARENRSSSTIAFANSMDEVGRKLKDELNEVNKYISRRSTDRELIKNVEKMLVNVHKMYLLETSKITME